MKKVSIIIPAYNEEESLPLLYDRLSKVILNLKNYEFELLFINDGSKDNTLKIIKGLREKDSKISYVDFSRNFGKEVAMIAGLDYAKGDCVIFIDADLQDPPELIPELIKYWEEGYDDVYARRKSRKGETFLKKFTSKMYYKVLQSLTRVEIQKDTGDFRLLDRRCVNALKQLRETQRCSKSMFSWIGYNKKEEPIFSKDLKAEGAMAVLLKDAIKPNLVQTLEHTPAIIHGGPFANIAHGCNSVIATKLGMELAEYTVTEAGFGADLGAEKFIDIKCRKAQIKPDVVICVATIKALKYHGGVSKEEILNENIEALKKGMKNLYKHIDNLKNIFGQNVIVAINKFNTDTGVELNYLKEELSKRNIKVSIVESWAKGGNGAIDIAQKIVNMPESQTIKYCYDLNDSIVDKVRKVAQNVYGAENVIFSDETMKKVYKKHDDFSYLFEGGSDDDQLEC